MAVRTAARRYLAARNERSRYTGPEGRLDPPAGSGLDHPMSLVHVIVSQPAGSARVTCTARRNRPSAVISPNM